MKPTTLASPKSALPTPPPAIAKETPKPTTTPSTPVTKGYAKEDSVEIKNAPTKDAYTWGPSTAQVKAGTAQLAMGQKGPAVSDVQTKLGLPATGKFDKNTEVSVAQFQKAQSLPTTGKVDAKTLAALDAKSGGAGGVAGAPATPTPKSEGPGGGCSVGGATATKPPPGKEASQAEKYNYAAQMLESGKLKPGQSKEADTLIYKMIGDSGTLIQSSETKEQNETATARTRFLKAAKDAGYTVPN